MTIEELEAYSKDLKKLSKKDLEDRERILNNFK